MNDLKNMTSYEFNKLSYKEQFNAVTKLSIEEVDSIDDTY